MAFDDFCLHTSDTILYVPCPKIDQQDIVCIPDVSGDGVPDYQVTFSVSDDAAGSISFTSSCGSISPNPIVLNGSGNYVTTLVSNGSCAVFSMNYQVVDANGDKCDDQELQLDLPECSPCPVLERVDAICIEDMDGDGTPDYQMTFWVSNDAAGALSFNSSCGTISPNPIALNGSGSYATTVIPNGNCTAFNMVYSVLDGNGNLCHREQIRVTLPKCSTESCPCDETFFDAVNAGFTYVEDCPNDFFTPINLIDPCDIVEWSVDGVYMGSTVGNATLTLPHIDGDFDLCMSVIRTDPATGQSCQYEICERLNATMFCSNPSPVFKLKVQPNPAQNQAVVSWATDEVPEQLAIRVFNIQGLQVLEQLTVNGYDGQTQLDISGLADGVYYIHASGAGYNVPPIKLIKQ